MVHKINIPRGAHVSGASLSFFPNMPHLPLIKGVVGFSRQGIRLIFGSKLFIASIVLAAISLGGIGYIATHKALVVQQPNIQNPSALSSDSAPNQTADTNTTAGSTTPAAGATKPSSGTTKSSSGSTSSSGTSTSAPSSGATTPTAPSGGGSLSNGSCFASPSSCGYPDATNTGPVAGTVFTKVPEQATSGNGWAWDSRGWISVSGSNVTLNGIQTSADIDITGNNVTIQNCKISEANGDFGVSARHTTNTTVKNCMISGTNATSGRLSVAIKSIYGDDVNLRSLANNISYVSTGIQYCQGLIQDNYIHDLGFQNGDHLNGTTSNSGCDQLTIKHNTIFNSFDQTDAISLFQDFGRATNSLVTNNYLAGGGYSIYGGGGSYGTATNIQITNNRISDHYYANGGYWGWLAHYDNGGSGNVCSGNILEHTATGATSALGC